MLDVELKLRHVSTEDLSHALEVFPQSNFHTSQFSFEFPRLLVIATWWYISCDLALIVGTFIRGLGNYDAMRNDKELPFGRIIAQFIIADSGSSQSFRSFRLETRAARKVFNDALSADKYKA